MEIRNFANPPMKVRLAMEPVIILLSKNCAKPEWSECKQYIKREDFIRSVQNFDKNDIPQKVKLYVTKNYIDNAEFDTAAIMKASKAAGPLAKWVESIVKYSIVFHSIAPLREELSKLDKETEEMVAEKKEVDDKIDELEQKIDTLKLEYAANIARVENIKNEMKSVEVKVTRSVQLIKNLSSERSRWDDSSKNFIE